MRRADPADTTFALHSGFYCIVDGRVFGPWPMLEYAQAGMRTEQVRAARRGHFVALGAAIGEGRAFTWISGPNQGKTWFPLYPPYVVPIKQEASEALATAGGAR